ncbi:MAG: sodium:proton antiporter [Verrucomicrobia bacterium]|nr:sodium:proton antiporter [Verrucomicrobiota bacterium]
MNSVPLITLLPFLLMLGAIAVMPLWFGHFWDRNRNKLLVAIILSVPSVLYLLFSSNGVHLYDTMVFDYLPFVILLGGLFVITGGIFVDTNMPATPAANAIFLAIGTVLASFLGTTGAAMLLIRPLLHMNRSREHKTHTLLFFIALVCNCGGLLTPLGDPPLFMMYLRGVPFEWFLKLAPEWLVANGILLVVFFVADRHFWKKESPAARRLEESEAFSLTVSGKLNFAWLAGVVLAVAFINPNVIPAIGSKHYFCFARELVIVALAGLSLITTPRATRVSNGFTWHPIAEVACLFLGIFATMVPCLLYLQSHAPSLAIPTPVFFYYATGLLSSVLDNTPTAVTYYSLAQGLNLAGPEMVAGVPESLMKAICTGAVFFGAMTYIGNGPNFMVKTIAERQNIKMPDFFSYVWRFSLLVLLPVFIIVQLIFMR